MHIVKVVASFILPDRGGGGGEGYISAAGREMLHSKTVRLLYCK